MNYHNTLDGGGIFCADDSKDETLRLRLAAFSALICGILIFLDQRLKYF
jgi:hypothetical protein